MFFSFPSARFQQLFLSHVCVFFFLGEVNGEGNIPATLSTRSKGQSEMNSHLPKVHLLIMAYFRGGSTFIGDILNYDPEAMYW